MGARPFYQFEVFYIFEIAHIMIFYLLSLDSLKFLTFINSIFHTPLVKIMNFI